MSRPDEGLIHQWLDGECTPEESARLEQLVATDPNWAAAVAEARGLIAASSRIVQSLDAVPLAMPKGSVAAPRLEAKRAKATAVRPWMRIAAALVLVAGTAYVLREESKAPFVPEATVDMPVPTPPPAADAGDISRIQVPSDVPPLGAAVNADRAADAPARGAAQGAGVPAAQPQSEAEHTAPASPPPPTAPVVSPTPTAKQTPARILESPNSISLPPAPARSRAMDGTRATDLAAQRRSREISDSPRGAIARPALVQSAAPAAPMEPVFLDGCWRVTAPPQLVGILERPALRRQSGDTLVLITMLGSLTVVRENDTLRGELHAVRESCPSTP